MGRMRAWGGRVRLFAANNAMPSVAVLAALATCLFVVPDAGYAGYMDWPTLGKLGCMLAAVGALREAGVFQVLATRLAARCSRLRSLVLVLVAATGVASMLITNDMALLALLPLSAVALCAVGEGRLVGPVFVLQGLAANLWGMVLPFGNPQNIYLVGAFNIAPGDFLAVMAAPFGISVAVVLAMCFLTSRRSGTVRLVCDIPVLQGARAAASSLLFALCVAAVLGAVPVWAACAVVAAALTALDAAAPLEGASRRWWFMRTDWGLLVTFAAFFVFSGNLSRIGAVQELFAGWLAGGAFVPAALLSQVISNVPAAVVLARFTGDWRGLLCGVNVGGAGTPLGSLATLIVIAQFAQAKPLAGGEQGSRAFRGSLLGLNFAALAVLLGLGVLLGW